MLIKIPDIALVELEVEEKNLNIFTEDEKDYLKHLSCPECLNILDDETKAKLIYCLIKQEGYDDIIIVD